MRLMVTERLVEPLEVLGFHWDIIACFDASGIVAVGPSINFSDPSNSMYVVIISAFV